MNIELNKKNKSMIAVWSIAAVVYILAFAIVPFPKNSASVWIAFLFTLVSVAASLSTALKAFGESGEVVSKFYGYPIFKIGAIYTVVQMIFSIIVFVVSAFVKIPYWIALLPSVVFLGVAAIGFVAADNAKDIVEKQDEDLKTATKTVEMFKADMASVVDLAKDDKIKAELEKLAEEFRYSDPVSSEATKELETKISAEIAELRDMVQTENSEKVKVKITEIRRLLNDRNRVCKLNK